MRNKPVDIGCNLGTRIEPGIYSAYVAEAHVYRDRFYKRWTCLLQCDVFDTNLNTIARIPLWLNLGSDDKPKAARRSRYFGMWITANGGNPPKRKDRLPPSVFLKRMTKVQIVDSVTKELPYSIVKDVLSWETGTAHHLISQSFNHSINQSTNQLIKEGMPQSACEQQVTEIACQSERRVTLENDAPVKASALAGVESQQPNSVQGRETLNSLPQRHSMPDVDRAERLALLKAQAASVAMKRS